MINTSTYIIILYFVNISYYTEKNTPFSTGRKYSFFSFEKSALYELVLALLAASSGPLDLKNFSAPCPYMTLY